MTAGTASGPHIMPYTYVVQVSEPEEEDDSPAVKRRKGPAAPQPKAKPAPRPQGEVWLWGAMIFMLLACMLHIPPCHHCL